MAILTEGTGTPCLKASCHVSYPAPTQKKSSNQFLCYSVLEGDQEGYDLWKKQGLSDDKIVSCGPEDNFWSMGDGEGPCGPCTEIFWDTMDDSLGEDR
jgi:alanyl-tRNA synthetase